MKATRRNRNCQQEKHKENRYNEVTKQELHLREFYFMFRQCESKLLNENNYYAPL